jgi:hypothetical protein
MLRILAVDCDASNKTTVYPNPFDNELIVNDAADSNVKVFNALGQKLDLSLRFSGNTLVYDTHDLPKGIYFVQIEKNGDIETIKVMK